MKVNSNFNAGATKKTETQIKQNPLEAAIQANFKPQEQVESTPAVPVKTIESEQVTNSQRKSEETKQKEVTAQKEKKESFLVSMSQGERSLYKSLCALQNVSMNHFVICAMDYFKEELEEGKITISKHGYKRV